MTLHRSLSSPSSLLQMDREVPMLQSHARRNVIRFPSLRDYFLPQLQQSLCTLKIELERGPSVLFSTRSLGRPQQERRSFHTLTKIVRQRRPSAKSGRVCLSSCYS